MDIVRGCQSVRVRIGSVVDVTVRLDWVCRDEVPFNLVDDDCDGDTDECCGPGFEFEEKVDYDVGNSPTSLVAGDFNSDDILDLAVANGTDDDVSVLLGNGSNGVGDGTFKEDVVYPASDRPASITAGDFDGNQALDLAVALHNSYEAGVLTGQGDGTFDLMQTYPSGDGTSDPTGIAAGDFNGDDDLDLAVANKAIDNVSVLLGNGDGTFANKVDFATANAPCAIIVRDFDKNDVQDLAVVADSGDAMSILLGNPDGTFGTRTDFDVGNGPEGATAGDFDGDQNLDIATANDEADTVSVILGRGDGTFGTHTDYGVGTEPESVAAGDVNRDSKLDLVAANEMSASISVLLGKGDGDFEAEIRFTTGSEPVSILLADFNEDGMLDVATANANSDDVSILLGKLVCGACP
jgi:hypothetical protein